MKITIYDLVRRYIDTIERLREAKEEMKRLNEEEKRLTSHMISVLDVHGALRDGNSIIHLDHGEVVIVKSISVFEAESKIPVVTHACDKCSEIARWDDEVEMADEGYLCPNCQKTESVEGQTR